MPDYDAIVIGARVAGSLTVTLLAERRWRVLLLDRASFPSDTISTHFFRAPALLAFRRAGVLDEVLATGAPRLRAQFTDFGGHLFRDAVADTQGFDYYLCVRRIALDEILVRRARREPTVDFRPHTTVRSLLMENGRVTGVRATGAEGSFDATARVVIGADGVRSLVARTVAATIEHAEPVRRAMYYGYFADLAPEEGPAAEFHFRGDELVYVFPCDASLTLLAVSIPIAEFPNWQRHHTTLFRESLRARPALAPRVARASQVGRVYGAGDIPGYIRVPYGAGWALVGDSALVMDPYSGQGIDQASTHAAFLADALHQWFAGEEPWERAMIGYRTRRNEFTEPTYRRTCNFARDLSQVVRTRLQERGVARSD